MDRATELGMKALALTDHGNLYGVIDFYKQAKYKGIKPLIGCELYLTVGSRLDRPGRSDESQPIFHLGLLARNVTGYQNLLKLVSDAHLKGFYYKPRTDFEKLAQHAKGLIGFTGCLASLVPQHLLHDRYKEAREACAHFVEAFGRENYFVEIQDHGIPEQQKIIPSLLKLGEEFNLKVICSNDVHYVRDTDAGPHDALLCIQTGAKIAEQNRMKFDSTQFYLKSHEEMNLVFGEIPESITNTELVAEMCDVSILFPKGSERYPRYPLPTEIKARTSPADYLKQFCIEGLKRRYGHDYESIAARNIVTERFAKLTSPADNQTPSAPDYSGLAPEEGLVLRMGFELAIISATGFVDYFLVVWDFIHWAKSKSIPVGPGRGSGAGCLVAYLLGITNLDPIRFKLLFERFLNPERISPPDFDIDFCMRRRGEVISYVRQKYGNDCVANIITYGTLGAKMVIRDVSRVHDLPYTEADRLAKMIPDDLNISLTDSITKSTELRKESEKNPVAKKIIDQALVLEGMVRNTSKHAAGIIITDKPLDEFVPLTLQEGDVTVQYDMSAIGKLGLLKMDFLGLKTLTVIADTVENIRRTADPKFDIEAIPLDDSKTYKILNAGKTVGVFQLESSGMQNACKQVGVTDINDINAICALYRPGPMQFIPDYARGKRDPSTVVYPHQLLEQSLQETYGIIVYQEQVIECAKIIAGCTLSGGDLLRRAMSKKDAGAMAKERIKFVEGAKRVNNIGEKKANEIFDLLNKFARYGFNKSHSAAYALISYQTAFLKANYPVQFMAAMLSAELGNSEKLAHFIAETEVIGITVLGPDVNESREMFTPINEKIRFGLAGIKGVGEQAAQKIIEERNRNGSYASFFDFASRVDTRALNKRVMEHLVKTGAFDFSGTPRKVLFDSIDSILAGAAVLARDRAAGQHSFLSMFAEEAAPKKIGSALRVEARANNDFTLAEHLQFEKELLGFYISGHPMDAYAGLAEALCTNIEELVIEEGNRTEFRLCGIASSITKKLSKRDNRPWVFFNLAKKRASVSVNMYAHAYENYAKNLAENQPIIVLGTMMRGEDGVRLNAKEVYPIDAHIPSNIKRITWLIDPTHAAVPDFLRQLRSILEATGGATHIELGFVFEGRVSPIAEVSQALRWRVIPQKFQELRTHPAVLGTQIEARPAELKRERRWAKQS